MSPKKVLGPGHVMVRLYELGAVYEMKKTGILNQKKIRIYELNMDINDHVFLDTNSRRNSPCELKNPHPYIKDGDRRSFRVCKR